ncbi:hypothetical protein [Hymenobacter volaticus]|uniref:Bacterial surface antigen (D15) domain-containing protein n=1 Tax=Hymenobacter volaticus TaxID=2932254 RepID=A0ABY4GC17_9BACT|nr:hypothetical protein [Hymenobacter volaticus]UOQ68336.1 hypothetical protein MUN86_11065 [Hymenobacter volaticus]
MPKGATALSVEIGQGFTRPRSGPELYLATGQLAWQKTLVPEKLRAGLVGGVFHPGYQIGGLAGARVTLKVFQLPSVLLSKAGHVHVLVEYLPAVYTSTHWRQWVGGGIGVETSNLLGVVVKLHRDVRTPTTYGQLALTYNLSHKSPPEL